MKTFRDYDIDLDDDYEDWDDEIYEDQEDSYGFRLWFIYGGSRRLS